MERQHVSRRIVLGAAVVGLAVMVLVGGGERTLAKEFRPGHGDKATFKSSCDQYGGTFIDSPKDGLTACFYGDGSKTVCDKDGNDCINYPPPPKKMVDTGLADPIVADAPLVAEDSQTVAPVHAPLEVIAEAPLEAVVEAPVDAPADSQVASAAESGTLAAPVEAPVALAEEPVAAEEPMTIEASAEQP
jgi:hypothetical protein